MIAAIDFLPWWDPYGWWAYLGWYPVLFFGLLLCGLVYLLDWLTPTKRLGTRLLDWLGA